MSDMYLIYIFRVGFNGKLNWIMYSSYSSTNITINRTSCRLTITRKFNTKEYRKLYHFTI